MIAALHGPGVVAHLLDEAHVSEAHLDAPWQPREPANDAVLQFPRRVRDYRIIWQLRLTFN